MSPLMQIFDKQFFYPATQTSVQEWGKSLEVDYDCVEVDVYNLLSLTHVYFEIRIKLSASERLPKHLTLLA